MGVKAASQKAWAAMSPGMTRMKGRIDTRRVGWEAFCIGIDMLSVANGTGGKKSEQLLWGALRYLLGKLAQKYSLPIETQRSIEKVLHKWISSIGQQHENPAHAPPSNYLSVHIGKNGRRVQGSFLDLVLALGSEEVLLVQREVGGTREVGVFLIDCSWAFDRDVVEWMQQKGDQASVKFYAITKSALEKLRSASLARVLP